MEMIISTHYPDVPGTLHLAYQLFSDHIKVIQKKNN